MSWTTDDLHALNRAIALGMRRVEYHDRIVEYRSLDEMVRIRKMMMGVLNPGSSRNNVYYASVSKGVTPG